MTELPSRSYAGTVPLGGDLSILESALHTGRVEAAELGYTAEPATIETFEAMPSGEGPEATLLSAEQAEAAGVPFSPSVLGFRMYWQAEGGSAQA